jgi:hypothetical protein
MAKESGLGWTTFSVDNAAGSLQDIKNDTTALNFSMPRGVQDITGLDKSAYERLLLLADFTCDPSGVFNDAANRAFPVLSTAGSSNTVRQVSIVVSGQTLSNECLLTDFQLQRPQSGELTWSAPLVLADGTVPTWS